MAPEKDWYARLSQSDMPVDLNNANTELRNIKSSIKSIKTTRLGLQRMADIDGVKVGLGLLFQTVNVGTNDMGKKAKKRKSLENLDETEDEMPGTIKRKKSRTLKSGGGGNDVKLEVDDDKQLKCPITGLFFNNPVKNKVCQHIYDRAGLDQMIRAKSKWCPVLGCNNNLSLSQVEEDEEMKLRVQKHKQNLAAAKKKKSSRKVGTSKTKKTFTRTIPVNDLPPVARDPLVGRIIQMQDNGEGSNISITQQRSPQQQQSHSSSSSSHHQLGGGGGEQQQHNKPRFHLSQQAKVALRETVLSAIRHPQGTVDQACLQRAMAQGLPERAILNAAAVARQRDQKNRQQRLSNSSSSTNRQQQQGQQQQPGTNQVVMSQYNQQQQQNAWTTMRSPLHDNDKDSDWDGTD